MLAEQGRLHYHSTAGLAWYGELTVASLNRDVEPSKAVRPEWREEVAALLRTTSPRMAPALPSHGSYNMPLYELGTAIGVGSTSVVVEAEAPRLDKGFAVKVVRRGQGVTPTTDVEREIMWEVHVLQQLHHTHIVRVMDVIDLVRAAAPARLAQRRHTPPAPPLTRPSRLSSRPRPHRSTPRIS